MLAVEAVLFVCGFFDLFPKPPGSANAFNWDMYGSILKSRYVSAGDWLWYSIHILSLLGLFLLWRPARHIATVALIYSVLSIGWSGIRVSAPAESVVQQISFVLYLFALAMSYLCGAVRVYFGPVSTGTVTDGT